MANRHLSRSIVLQTLFEWDVKSPAEREGIDSRDLLRRNIEEFASGSQDVRYMERLLSGVFSKSKDLDLIIEKAAPDWPLDKIAVVDRNILRLGLYELLFADRNEVPAKVAINEAIELGKNFGGENSGRFINGVLGAVYKEIGEPGKEEAGRKKKKKTLYKKDVPYEQMPVERKGGSVVYTREGEEVFVALVHDVFGHWTLPKGGIEVDEDEKKAIAREVKDEIGISIILEEKLGENEYVASNPEKGKLRKQVVFYLARSSFDELTLEEKGGLDDARWFKLQDILDLNFYHDMLPIITKAINLLIKK
jgi:transcription antitermination protein NusB